MPVTFFAVVIAMLKIMLYDTISNIQTSPYMRINNVTLAMEVLVATTPVLAIPSIDFKCTYQVRNDSTTDLYNYNYVTVCDNV